MLFKKMRQAQRQQRVRKHMEQKQRSRKVLQKLIQEDREALIKNILDTLNNSSIKVRSYPRRPQPRSERRPAEQREYRARWKRHDGMLTYRGDTHGHDGSTLIYTDNFSNGYGIGHIPTPSLTTQLRDQNVPLWIVDNLRSAYITKGQMLNYIEIQQPTETQKLKVADQQQKQDKQRSIKPSLPPQQQPQRSIRSASVMYPMDGKQSIVSTKTSQLHKKGDTEQKPTKKKSFWHFFKK